MRLRLGPVIAVSLVTVATGALAANVTTGSPEVTNIGSHPSYGTNYSAFWRTGKDYALLAEATGQFTYVNVPSASGAILFRAANFGPIPTLDGGSGIMQLTRDGVSVAQITANVGTSNGAAVKGLSNAGTGVFGFVEQGGSGVMGQSASGEGITGLSTDGQGVHGKSQTGNGVYGESDSVGVHGLSSAGYGVSGDSTTSVGVIGNSQDGYGIEGKSVNNWGGVFYGTYGVYGSGTTYGVYGTGTTYGVYGSGTTYGVYSAGPFYVNSPSATKAGGSPSFIITSDARTKKDVADFTDGLAQIEKVRTVKFKYNGLAGTIADDKEYVGVLAQDLEKVAPYMISATREKLRPDDKDTTGVRHVDVNAFTYMLINSVQELSRQNRKLREDNARMNGAVSDVKRLVCASNPGDRFCRHELAAR